MPTIPSTQELPTGTITLVMTDVEGSTEKWERDPLGMSAALLRHDALADEAFRQWGGRIVKSRGEGDSLFVVFGRPQDAVEGALAFQRPLAQEPWSDGMRVRVRIAIHTGEAILRDHDYYGPAVNRCARLRAIGHGGQTLISHATYSLVQERALPDVSFRSLGLHRLKDLMRPEQVWQVDAGDPTQFPTLTSLNAHAHNLPRQLTPFVGRQEDLRRVAELLTSRHLVTISGAGGCGKTRLALQIAAEETYNSPDGVWFVELADLRQAEQVAVAVARTLNAREGDRAGVDEVVRALDNQRTLLVLDNCEHLLDPVADMVHAILSRCPRVKVIATSREPLALDGECVYRIPPLALPHVGAALRASEVENVDAIRLFVERAKAASNRFQLSSSNTAAVVELCQRLDGIPLAIEQAAAHVAYLSPAQILSRIIPRLRAPQGQVGVDARHRTMEDTIAWSVDLLQPSSRTVFLRLATFVGGWTLEAAEAICGDAEVPSEAIFDTLWELVQKSLVAVEETASGANRYRFLEPIRQFAAARHRETDRDEERHYAYYRDFARSCEKDVEGARQTECLDALDREAENVRKALAYGWREARPDVLAFVFSLRHYWNRRGRFQEARTAHERTLALFESAPDRAALHNSLGAVYWYQGDTDRAREAYEASLANAVAARDRELEAKVRHNLAILASEAGAYEKASVLYRESLAIFEAVGNTLAVGTALSNLGDLYTRMGEHASAVATLDRALGHYRTVGNEAKVARIHHNLAFARLHGGDSQGALRALKESFLGWQRVPDPALMAEGLLLFAAIAIDREPDLATCLMGTSQILLEKNHCQLRPADQAVQAELTQNAQLRLGIEGFREVTERGRTMPTEAALSQALVTTEALIAGS